MDIDTYKYKARAMPLYFMLTILVVAAAVSNRCYGNYKQHHDKATIRVGQAMPEVTFDNVLNSSSGTFSTKDMVRPTILYFISAVCSASFKHLSEIDDMYSAYKQDFNLLLVALDLDDNIQRILQVYSQKYDLQIPIAFDKTIYKQYNIRGVPYVIWINEKGTVQAITNVLNQGYLERFVKGKYFDHISYDPEVRETRKSFDPDEPFLVNGNGGEAHDFLQRSLLAKWKIGMPNDMPFAEPNKSPLEGLKYLQVTGRELADLYRIAYFGKTFGWHPGDSAYGNYHYSPILEIEDESRFESDYSVGKNLFCYSQVLPPERRNPAQMMAVMRRDLKNFFGYDVVVETRMMPYLSLTATDKARKRLLNRGKSGESSYSLIQLRYIDKPISSLVSTLSYNLGLTFKDLPLIDETGIKGNIDITLAAIMTDLEEVKIALRKRGLDLIQTERPMKVIVIRDPKLR